ncbi:MAG: CCA tRNA nucleotidyltransferase [Ruminococcus sp.]|nr:CCA tRNA nucleotidyltransferase [Ruminococcus sp.]
MKIYLPENVKLIIDKLRNSGYNCYAVGGCVRDSLRGVAPHDWDFTTSATPDEIERVFADHRTIDVGKNYGTVAVLMGGELYEITTYRIDGKYSDSRHPDAVRFSDRIKDDLARRDFTVNAMAYNDCDGLIDLFGGGQDLAFGVIRCVGRPDERFCEDALRILRALRFASVLGFTIEPETSEAILKQKGLLNDIAAERIREEFLKLLCGDKADFILRRYRKVISVFIPELRGTFDFEQNSRHHNRDLYRHTVAAVHNVEPEPLLRVTMLFHDIGKPLAQTTDKQGVCHYHGHQKLGAAMTREILRRLCMPSVFIDEVCTLIRWHDERFKPDTVMIKRYLKRLGADAMQKLMLVQRADILAQSPYMREEKLSNLTAVSEELNRIITSGECYSLRQLSVNGSDLLHLGMSSGIQIGQTLDQLLDKVIEGELPNEKELLLDRAKIMIDNGE